MQQHPFPKENVGILQLHAKSPDKVIAIGFKFKGLPTTGKFTVAPIKHPKNLVLSCIFALLMQKNTDKISTAT